MMLGTLLKKELYELNRSFFYDAKKGKMRSKGAAALYIALYALLVVGVLGSIFTMLAFTLGAALVPAGYGWLYFLLFSLMATALGVFGSVFNTFSGLYMAKDNDLLLSMPIPVRYILASRLLGTYLLGLMFSGIILIPGAVVYFFFAKPTAGAVLGALLLVLLISLVVLVLTCALGFVVARISAKLKNKSFLTVLLSLVFLGAYYFFYFRASTIINALIENMTTVGDALRGNAYPLYLIGRVGEGDGMATLIVTAAVLALTALTYLLLERSFIAIATAKGGTAKARYRERAAVRRTPARAMLAKEFARFTSSPSYMLNCGLGTLMLPIAAVYLLIRCETVRDVVSSWFAWDTDFPAAIAIGCICLLASMNDTAAPSVSLEGKSLWIAQSLPVHPWTALRAKLAVQLILTAPPVLFASVSALFVLRPSLAASVAVVVLPLLYVLLSALFGLMLGVRNANLVWTNEIIPIKQSVSVMLALLSGWGYAAVFVLGVLFLGAFVSVPVFAAVFAVLTAALCILLYRWLRTRGAARFAAL